MISTLISQFEYEEWANQKASESLQAMSVPPSRGLAFLDHIVGAGWLWFDRLHDQKQRMEVWPTFIATERQIQLRLLSKVWANYLATLDLAGLRRMFRYTNSKGEHWSGSVQDALWHLPLHGAYHRGQIALLVRDAGGEPAYTDYIHAVRTHAVTPPSI